MARERIETCTCRSGLGAADTGWPLAGVVGGLSVGLLAAAFASPKIGIAIHHHGGRPVLAIAALLLAAGLTTLALAPVLPGYQAC